MTSRTSTTADDDNEEDDGEHDDGDWDSDSDVNSEMCRRIQRLLDEPTRKKPRTSPPQ